MSVLLTGKDAASVRAKVLELKRQDHPDFEIVAVSGGPLTSGYNRAIRRAKGKILVFTETDTVALSRSWLRQLAAQVREGEVVKGLEVFPPGFNFSNSACYASVAKRIPLNERYRLSSDTEWSRRLQRHGIRMRTIYSAGVLHLRRPASGKALRWAYQYGREWVRLHREGLLEEFESLVEQTKHQIAVGRARLRGISDEMKAVRNRPPERVPRDRSTRRATSS